MGTIKEGARQAVENCLKVKDGEKVVIITDRETFEVGSVIKETVEKITDNIQFFVMEDFGERPLNLPNQIAEELKEADVSFYVARGVGEEFRTFRRPMTEIVDANKKLRHAHMFDITKELMEDGMCSDYEEIQRISKLVYLKVRNAKTIRVITDSGTDIIAQFSPDIKWAICDGNIGSEHWSNLPDGEVFTCPANINGIAVIDGCLDDFFTEKYGSLEKTPITVNIKNGRAVPDSIKCSNKELEIEFNKYIFETDKNSSRVGEFALGTNVGLKKLVGSILQDEKFPGVHIAFGSPLPDHTGADWDSDIHVDCGMKNTTVYVGNKTIMKKGKYIF